MLFRTKYDGLNRQFSDSTSLSDFEPTLTVQECAEDCDINRILERFSSTGILSHTNSSLPRYGDFSNIGDFQQSLDLISDAINDFMDLPANVRKRFDNDPARYVDFCLDPENYDEAVRLGISAPPPRGDTPECLPCG